MLKFMLASSAVLAVAAVTCIPWWRSQPPAPAHSDLLPNSPEVPCTNFRGTWTDDASATWTIAQVDSKITGTLVDSDERSLCGDSWTTATWDIVGSYDVSTGSAAIDLINPRGGNEACTPGAGSLTMLVDKPGCNIAHADVGGFHFSLRKDCDVPSGEDMSFSGWIYGGLGSWTQTLRGEPDSNYGGRVVTEQDPGGGRDWCWFVWSAVKPFVSVRGSSWNVAEVNSYWYDWVGWRPDGVRFYRQKGEITLLGLGAAATGYRLRPRPTDVSNAGDRRDHRQDDSNEQAREAL